MAWRQAIQAFARLPDPTMAQHQRVHDALVAAPAADAAIKSLLTESSWATGLRKAAAAPLVAPFTLPVLLAAARRSNDWMGACFIVSAFAKAHPAAVRDTHLYTAVFELQRHHGGAAEVPVPRVAQVMRIALALGAARADARAGASLRGPAYAAVCRQIERYKPPPNHWEAALSAVADTISVVSPPTPIEAAHVMSAMLRMRQWMAALEVAGRWLAHQRLGSEASVLEPLGKPMATGLVGTLALEALAVPAPSARVCGTQLTSNAAFSGALWIACSMQPGRLPPAVLPKAVAACRWDAGLRLLRWARLADADGPAAAGDADHPLARWCRVGERDGATKATPGPTGLPVSTFAAAIDANGGWVAALRVVAAMRSGCGGRKSAQWGAYAEGYPQLIERHGHGHSRPDFKAQQSLGRHVQMLLLRLAKAFSRSATSSAAPPADMINAVLSVVSKSGALSPATRP